LKIECITDNIDVNLCGSKHYIDEKFSVKKKIKAEINISKHMKGKSNKIKMKSETKIKTNIY
jgi:hypothetical protein